VPTGCAMYKAESGKWKDKGINDLEVSGVCRVTSDRGIAEMKVRVSLS